MKNDKKSYITLQDGCDFRTIADTMSEAGWTMNHATARNQLIVALQDLFVHIGKKIGIKLDRKQIDRILKDQEVHNALSDILYVAYNNKNEVNKND